MRANKEYFDSKNDSILNVLSLESVEGGDYDIFQQIMLMMTPEEEHFEMCFEQYLEKVSNTERNLVLSRFVLYLMIHDKLERGYLVNEIFKGIQGYAASKEARMLKYLFFACRKNSLEIYQKLREKYVLVLDRDKHVGKMVGKVGETFCGAQPEGGFNMFNMVRNMFK